MKPPQLLTRDQFREAVFARDADKCVICGAPPVSAHHIVERRLWSNGGYYIDNGASVCDEHHRACERTTISVEQIREACGITRVVLPEQFYDDQPIDKWGNPILDNGQRMMGELFFDESVQKVLKEGGALDLFTRRVKYPRTFHLPWSPGIHDDDRVIRSLDGFIGQRVIVMEKMDGENTSGCADGYIHARSIDGRNHDSRNWVKNFLARVLPDLPENWRINVENLYALHSVRYDWLKSYAYGFKIWNDVNFCLDWDSTVEWFSLLGVETCPVLYDGIFDQKKIQSLYDEKQDWERSEGYVVRTAAGFPYGRFRNCVAKFVRARHIQTAPHNWLRRTDYERNRLIDG